MSSEEIPRCICGKRCKVKVDGEMGKTCGNRSCSGRLSKIHMREVMKTEANVRFFVLSYGERGW